CCQVDYGIRDRTVTGVQSVLFRSERLVAQVAWQILALNTEKAHNLRDKSLEVIRIFRNLIEETPGKSEKEFSYYLEEPSFVTMGLCYEKNVRFSGAV